MEGTLIMKPKGKTKNLLVYEKLRQRGSKGNDRKSYHDIGDLKTFPNGRSTLNQVIRTFDQNDKSDYE